MMSESDISLPPTIQRLAVRQLADYDARDPGTIFETGIELSVEQAYAVQAAVSRLRQYRGENVIGYKVGCTAEKTRQQLKIDHCVSGKLYDSERYPSGVKLRRSEFANLAIEGELAVELSREPRLEDFVDSRLPCCVARVFPVIELHHFVMRGTRSLAGQLIANNAIHGGFVEGTAITLEKRTDEKKMPTLTIFAEDEVMDACSGAVLIDTVSSSLLWLMQFLHDRNERLAAGQIVLTGSIPHLMPIESPREVRVLAPPFGCVEASFS